MPYQFPAPGRLPPGVRVYAVGDVHGCLDRLLSVHALIAEDLAARPVRESCLVHLGDYVDRGPDSAGVLRHLREGALPPVSRRVALMGNHDALMLSARQGNPESLALWLGNGGAATLESYGIAARDRAIPARWGAISQDDIDFLTQLPLMHREGGYVFVHAGIRPGRELGEQVAADLLWIREPFLSDESPRDFVVVHGHTPTVEPEILPARVGLDTGAALGGRLTCGVFEEETVGFLVA